MGYLQKAPGKGTFGVYKIDGQDIPVINQERKEDCGPSCIGLILGMMGHAAASSVTAAYLRALSQDPATQGAAYRPAPEDAGVIITPG